MSKRGRARRFLSNMGGRPGRSARVPSGQRLVYEDDIYLRPVGHRVLLLDVPFTPNFMTGLTMTWSSSARISRFGRASPWSYLGVARSDDPEDG